MRYFTSVSVLVVALAPLFAFAGERGSGVRTSSVRVSASYERTEGYGYSSPRDEVCDNREFDRRQAVIRREFDRQQAQIERSRYCAPVYSSPRCNEPLPVRGSSTQIEIQHESGGCFEQSSIYLRLRIELFESVRRQAPRPIHNHGCGAHEDSSCQCDR